MSVPPFLKALCCIISTCKSILVSIPSTIISDNAIPSLVIAYSLEFAIAITLSMVFFSCEVISVPANTFPVRLKKQNKRTLTSHNFPGPPNGLKVVISDLKCSLKG